MVKKILVSGLVNVETSLHVDSFPITYCPIEYPFFGINSCVSGVGYNVARAIKTLGGDLTFLSEVGDDFNGETILTELKREHIDARLLMDRIKHTPASIILVDKSGKRKIYSDLKDTQDLEPFEETVINLDEYSLAVMTNINFNRKLTKAAHEKGIIVATDCHVLSNVDDPYNKDFMENCDILFLSNEAVKDKEKEFMKKIYNRYHNKIIVCGRGEKGALMYIGYEDKFYSQNAVAPKGIKSTVGAGDALFSSFVYFYQKGENLQKCLQKAVIFAGLKISCSGGSRGFVPEEELLQYLKD